MDTKSACSTQLNSTQLNLAQLKPTQPNSTQSNSAQLNSTQLKSTHRNSTKLSYTQLNTAETETKLAQSTNLSPFKPKMAEKSRFLAQTRHFLANFVATFGRFPSGLWEYENRLNGWVAGYENMQKKSWSRLGSEHARPRNLKKAPLKFGVFFKFWALARS